MTIQDIKAALKIFSILLVVILYPTNYYICERIYPDDKIAWWTLRLKIYGFMFILPLLANTIKVESKMVSFFEYLILGIMIGDAGAFISFNETAFGWFDIVCILTTAWIGYFKVYKNKSSVKS